MNAANEPDQHSEETIFSEALRLPPGAERVAYLEAACAGHDALRERINALLRTSPDVGNFMEHAPGVFPGEEGSVTRIGRGMIDHCFGANTAEVATGTRIGKYKLLQ